ncbi:MAG: hypothetical protein PHT96_04785 [Syntrophorhabdaceae bacterium]|nr:hypothetical protein [Syntrophorhabdaceae bacterium]MDD4195716.1 hypothetical protein [Syntrophorhabdaceae bacterium]HOC46780.1 hypothetical protein [Syntrophorhabdaceae bacterium]
MTETMNENNLDVLAEKEYKMLVLRKEVLAKEVAEIDKKLKPLEDYLKAVQILVEQEEKKKGSRKKVKGVITKPEERKKGRRKKEPA